VYVTHSALLKMLNVMLIKGVRGVQVTTLGFNNRADSESKTSIYTCPIGNSSGVTSF